MLKGCHFLDTLGLVIGLFALIGQAFNLAMLMDLVTRTILLQDPHTFPFIAHIPYALECRLSVIFTADKEPVSNAELYLVQVISKFLKQAEQEKAQENEISTFMEWFTYAFPEWLAQEDWVYHVPQARPNDPSMNVPFREMLQFAIIKAKLSSLYQYYFDTWDDWVLMEEPTNIHEFKWRLPIQYLLQKPRFSHYEEGFKSLCLWINPAENDPRQRRPYKGPTDAEYKEINQARERLREGEKRRAQVFEDDIKRFYRDRLIQKNKIKTLAEFDSYRN
jgi:hypothetical protein